MRNIELRHKFPPSLSGRNLKKVVPGIILALLATPTLAAEQQQGNALTLGGVWMLRHAILVRIKAAPQRPWCLITRWQMVSSSAVRGVSVTATISVSWITALR
ncbi:hypothetical protein GA0061071_10865 [Kosakonia oryzendophytica]|uniref:Uncharacterized protein n=1 Tax=Kosakonia oryzendophytica TaxID=1005665 RepID=A0A1C4CM45_9ENTR|nr:hypothetical protein GA0061071_10865 [Kosakonia oryzendophytica]